MKSLTKTTERDPIKMPIGKTVYVINTFECAFVGLLKRKNSKKNILLTVETNSN